MKDKEKIRKLEREIKRLEEEKSAKDRVNELLKKRNELKYTKLYGAGRVLKKFGEGLSNWADKKSKQMEEEMKLDEQDKKEEGKSDKYDPNDLYEAMFGETEMSKELERGLGLE